MDSVLQALPGLLSFPLIAVNDNYYKSYTIVYNLLFLNFTADDCARCN